MSQVPLPDPAGAPSFPPRVRSWVYLVGLCLGAVCNASIMITAVVSSQQNTLLVAGVAGAILSSYALLSNGLGVAYRPSALLAPAASEAVRRNGR